MPVASYVITMSLIDKLKAIQTLKFCFGKAYRDVCGFGKQVEAISMCDMIIKLGIDRELSPEYQIRGIFLAMPKNGTFIFNLEGVNVERAKKGFQDFDEAYGNGMITEWELSMILSNDDYLGRTIFHDGNKIISLQ